MFTRFPNYMSKSLFKNSFNSHLFENFLSFSWVFQSNGLKDTLFHPIGGNFCVKYKSSDSSDSNINITQRTQMKSFISQESDLVDKMDRPSFQKWLDMFKFSGGEVPEVLTEQEFEFVFQLYLESTQQAKKHLRFLLIKELMKKKSKLKEIERKEMIKEKRAILYAKPQDHIMYGLWNHSMYGRIYKTSLNNLHYHRLKTAQQFGLPLIIDFGFENCHTLAKEVSSLREQILLCIRENLRHIDPFNLYFCNLNQDLFDKLKSHVNVLVDPTLPMHITSKSYLDLFPKEKLCYLTPDSRTTMKSFDYDLVYIIGGIVDLRAKKPLTLAKAKKEGIKTMKLPLLQYLEFKHKPSFGIHIMMGILLELQHSGDFIKAFKYIPKRFLRDPDFAFGESPWDQRLVSRPLKEFSKPSSL